MTGNEATFDATLDWCLERSPQLWPARLQGDRAALVRVAAAVVELVLPDWRTNRPTDTVPPRAVEAALASSREDDPLLRRHAQVLARGCSVARRRSLGTEHRIAEAARAVANAAVVSSDASAFDAIGEAFTKTEEHLVFQCHCAGVYGQESEVRARLFRRIVEICRSNA